MMFFKSKKLIKYESIKDEHGLFYVKGIFNKSELAFKLILASTKDPKVNFNCAYPFGDLENQNAVLHFFFDALKSEEPIYLKLINYYAKGDRLVKSICRTVFWEE